MKMTMFGLVLAFGMAFSAFAADEPKEIKLEGSFIQQPAPPVINFSGSGWSHEERF